MSLYSPTVGDAEVRHVSDGADAAAPLVFERDPFAAASCPRLAAAAASRAATAAAAAAGSSRGGRGGGGGGGSGGLGAGHEGEVIAHRAVAVQVAFGRHILKPGNSLDTCKG
jgi:hypothetical protein